MDQEMAIKEMSHFGGSLQSQSIYSSAPQHQIHTEASRDATTAPHAQQRIKLKFCQPKVYDSNMH